jgi:hypothetical protein
MSAGEVKMTLLIGLVILTTGALFIGTHIPIETLEENQTFYYLEPTNLKLLK